MRKPLFFIQCVAALASVVVLSTAAHAQKTARACEAEWRANKVTIQASGEKKKDFITKCRAGTEQTAAAPAAPAVGTTQTTPSETTKTEPTTTPRRTRRGRTAVVSTGANEFATEMEAKAHCPGETVVWANTRSKVYHFEGSRAFGKTRRGAYMCEKDTVAAGIRSAKNEKHP